MRRNRSAQRTDHVRRLKAEDAAQHPFGFQQDGQRHEHMMLCDQALRPTRLSGIVIHQVADDDVSIDNEHGAGGRR